MVKFTKLFSLVERGTEARQLSENPQLMGPFGWFEWGAICVMAFGLMVMNFLGDPTVYIWMTNRFNWISQTYWELGHLLFWVCACVLGYVALPVCYLMLSGRRLSDYYLGVSGSIEHARVYLIILFPISLIVFWVSYWSSFQEIYPFYTLAGRSLFDLVVWELAYGVQFASLEFFFRAFMLESLRKSLGYGSIAFMLIPYCMIHFQKTFVESAGSLFAGLLLGFLAMRGRSIWGGVFVHWFVAVEMDLLSLAQSGRLPW